ncbi:hypothetical protein GQ55_4G253100 [Panicum hallii var. hallii]|uniref:AT-hook motif nuclear-localized protein n=1 Tax=Panicum hallii var. hallii TaxID=1504633 RepID=A0A2T7E014_9POAL|nr:hypothetical protein GQ55_4G253100 [Panicum hallii var. hallii]
MSSAAEAAYGGGVQKGALQQHQPGPGALLYPHNGVAVYRKPAIPPFYQQPAASNAAAPTAPTRSSASAEPLKRKRGRPRKYGPADGAQPLAVVSPSQPAPAPADVGTNSGASPMLPPGFSPSPQGGGVVSPRASPAAAPPLSVSNASPAKKRGRPLGSTNKKPQPQAAAPGPGWAGLKPHVFTVPAGEDIASRAMSFSGNGWAVCILTANGAVSNVTLRQGDSSGGTVTYEGRFEILSLAGSYLLSESAGMSSRTGGLSVSLSGPDGRVLGGAVAGPLTAASPVQVVIGSFLADGKLELDPGSSPDKTVFGGFPTASSPSSRGNESSGGHGSPPNPAASFNTGSQPSFPNYPTWK